MTQLLMAASHCDVCGVKINGTCVDGRTRMGPWGLMCLKCHRTHGVGLGVGKGQRYTRRADGTFWKEGTGPIAPPVRPTTVVDRVGMVDLKRLDGQCDPIADREMLKRELGLTDDEISRIRPSEIIGDADDPWFI